MPSDPEPLPKLMDYIEQAPCNEAAVEGHDLARLPQFQHCGQAPRFRPFTKYGQGGRLVSYRAFMVCEVCGNAIEF